MKQIVNLTVFFASILLISGCDEIDPLKTPYKTSGTVIEVTGTQKVLIEDFTGFKCGNCPAAADKAKALSQSYPEKVILLAIHSGETFARPSGSKYKVDFRTSPGDELFNTFLGATGGQPNGMVNRATLGSSKIIAPDGWANEVANQLSKKAPASMDIVPTYNASTQELSVNVATTWIEEGNADQYLSVYLSEDSIVYWQKDYRKTPEDDSAYVEVIPITIPINDATEPVIHKCEPNGFAPCDQAARLHILVQQIILCFLAMFLEVHHLDLH